jgi:hypothetical protein
LGISDFFRDKKRNFLFGFENLAFFLFNLTFVACLSGGAVLLLRFKSRFVILKLILSLAKEFLEKGDDSVNNVFLVF